MTPATLARLPTLAVAVGLLAWGALESNARGFDKVATSLLAAGLVVLGAWLALELQAADTRRHHDTDNDPST